MTRATNRLFNLIATFLSAFMLQTVHAEQVPMRASTAGVLAVQLPDVDRGVLIEQLRLLRSQLIQRKQALVQIVADKKLDGSDALITAIMPGGLLYAGYKKVRYEQAKSELARISADIKEYSGDLLVMQSGSVPVLVARQY